MTRRYAVGLALASGVLALDLATKRWAAATLADGPETLIPGFLRLTYVENPGGAFSLFPDSGAWLGLAAIVISVYVLYVMRRPRPVLELVALGLVLGGALGNVADRVFRGPGLLDGSVIDWIDLWWIPTFNIADAAVTTAVVVLVIEAWRIR